MSDKAHQKRPVIGVTLDREDAGGYATVPWYALRENYCASLSQFDADVIALPAHSESALQYAHLCDGIVISGGGFDIDPSLFGAENVHESVNLKPERTDFEVALVKAMVELRKPLLGICGGEQLLAALYGGVLYQHIPDEVANALNHSPSGSIHNPSGNQHAHSVTISSDTLLAKICGTEEFIVNSSHHQAVSHLRSDSPLKINAISPDGVVEGIELPDHPFCIGVQWHPEYEVSAFDTRILSAFVDACRK